MLNDRLNQRMFQFRYVSNTTSSDILAVEENEQQLHIQAIHNNFFLQFHKTAWVIMNAGKTDTEGILDLVCE